ncbi:response regulator [Rhizobium mongolense]
MVRHILIVDDDSEIRKLTSRYLEEQGFRTSVAASCDECERLLLSAKPDLILLDVMLPDRSGLTLCQSLRERGNQIPIILLTALKEDVDRIIGLEIGADDYMVKPFVPRELIARINAVLRRYLRATVEDRPVSRYRFDVFTLEPTVRRLSTAYGSPVELTGAEFDLLKIFLDRPGILLTREKILDLTAGRKCDPFNRSIDVLLSRLRRKLSEFSGAVLFRTIRNGGYQFTARVSAERDEQ